MALFGVPVVRDDGSDASGRRAVVRTLALPLSFLFLGLRFAGILLGDRRRALHDVIGGTAVIYSSGRTGGPAAVPVPGLITGLVRSLLWRRVGVLDRDPGAFWRDRGDRDADLEDSLAVPGSDVRRDRPWPGA